MSTESDFALPKGREARENRHFMECSNHWQKWTLPRKWGSVRKVARPNRQDMSPPAGPSAPTNGRGTDFRLPATFSSGTGSVLSPRAATITPNFPR